jgi:hypothetical protein
MEWYATPKNFLPRKKARLNASAQKKEWKSFCSPQFWLSMHSIEKTLRFPQKKETLLVLLCAYLSLCFFHCGITQPVRVLNEGVTKASASLGGPLIPLGKATIPVPYLTAGVQHGYSSSLTLTGNVHLLTALLGDVGGDAGAAQRFVSENGWVPELTAKAQLYFFYDVKRGNNPRLFPFLSLNASYLLGESTLLYFGADNLFQFVRPAYFLSPFAGSQFPLSHRIDMQFELKWMAANGNTEHGIMEGHNSINGRGNVGTFLGFHYLLTSP